MIAEQSIRDVLTIIGLILVAYYTVYNLTFLAIMMRAALDIAQEVRWPRRVSLAEIFANPQTPGVSIIVPAHNEEAGIIPAVDALRNLRYPVVRIIIVDDGSTDATFQLLHDHLGLTRAFPRLTATPTNAGSIGDIWATSNGEVTVIRKESTGRRSDAINAGLRAADQELICMIDADSLLEPDALLYVVEPLIADPTLVGVGGIVRPSNGARVEHGAVVDVQAPRTWLESIQALEYLRAFLIGRTGWSAVNGLLIIGVCWTATSILRYNGRVPAGATQTGPVRLDSLTSLRFFAAGLVLVHHAFYLLMPGSLGAAVTSVGYVGVGFFFVLSGFVLAWTYKPSLATRHFYGRRFARIYPLHIGTAVLALILLLATVGSVPFWPSVLNVFLLQSWVPIEEYGSSLNGVSWSLCCEAFFYLCFPVLIRLAHRWNLPVAAVATILTMIAVAALSISIMPADVAQQFLYKGPLFRIGEFILGILLAIGFQRGFRLRIGVKPALLVMVLAYVAALALGPVLARLGLPHFRAFADLMVLPASCLLIHAAAASDMRHRDGWLRAKPLVALGDASFALYMIHFLILQVWVDVFGSADAGSIAGYATLLALCVVSVAASIAAYRWYEHPLERVLRARLGTPPRVPEPRLAH